MYIPKSGLGSRMRNMAYMQVLSLTPALTAVAYNAQDRAVRRNGQQACRQDIVRADVLTFGRVTAQRGTPPCAPLVLKSMGLTPAAATLINTSPGRL